MRDIRNLLKPIDLSLFRGVGETGSDLDEVVEQLVVTNSAAEVYDTDWRLIWLSEEICTILGEHDPEKLGIGKHYLEFFANPTWRSMMDKAAFWSLVSDVAPLYTGKLDDLDLQYWTPAERKKLAKLVQQQTPAIGDYWTREIDFVQEGLPNTKVWAHNIKLPKGFVRIYSPGLRASIVNLVARGDETMLDQMVALKEPNAHQAAMVFLDLEGSAKLGKRLPSDTYFHLLARMSEAVDTALINEGGFVAKHVGDGAVGFIVNDDDASLAALGAIRAGRAAQRAIKKLDMQLSKELRVKLNLKLNGSIHFSPTLYMGQIITQGRLEVTAIGDEVNQCARMLEAASGGSLFVSKELIETLNGRDKSVGLDSSLIVYHLLKEYDISPKALQDAGHLSVFDLAKN